MVSTVRQDSNARLHIAGRVREADVAAFVDGTRARQQYARYPELFGDADHAPQGRLQLPSLAEAQPREPAPIFRIERTQEGASGLVVIALRHGNLTARQWRALCRFRLEQCLLCGWYDAKAVLESGDILDPACETVGDDAIHLIVGTREGLILSYFCFEPASSLVGEVAQSPNTHPGFAGAPNGPERAGAAADPPWTIGDRGRPLFATERDLFGPSVFATLPGLESSPISRVREVNYLMRNQVVPLTSRLGSLAVVEAVSAVGQLLFASSPPLVALVGNMDLEARRLLYDLDVPVLYAPHMPVVTGDQQCPWSADVDMPGRFWPFVISATDLQATYRDYPKWLDTVLGLPVSQAVLALMRKRRGPKVQPPMEFTPYSHVSGTSGDFRFDGLNMRLHDEAWVSHLDVDVTATPPARPQGERTAALVAAQSSPHSS